MGYIITGIVLTIVVLYYWGKNQNESDRNKNADRIFPPLEDNEQVEAPNTQSLLTTCRACDKHISLNAASCPHCGEPMAPQTRQPHMVPQYTYSPGLAGVLSFFIPGLGQLYRGKIFGGLLWFVFTAIGYFFLFVPGLIIHLFCIIDAVSAKQ